MAEALAGQGMNDDALALLRRTQVEWNDVPRASESCLTPAIARGTPVAPNAPLPLGTGRPAKAGAEANRGFGYLSSKDVLALLNASR
jgi:hypothetical protein